MSQWIVIRGVEHYYEWVKLPGDHPKPVMVFVHGWGGSARYWQKIATALAPQFDCLLYDLRGFGRSANGYQANSNYELESYAEDLFCLLEELGLSQVYLHTHSMGASIGTLFLAEYPEKVIKAILTCNGIFEYNKAAFEAFYFFGRYVVKFRYQWFLNVPWADRLFMSRFLNRSIPSDEYQPFLEDFLMANDQAALETIYTCVSQRAVEIMPKKFAQISVPTLLISGEKDQIIPAKLGRSAAALNDKIAYLEIAKTGHFPMLEAPETYLKSIQKFIEDGL